MTRWKYFYVTDGDHTRNPEPRGLGRTDEDAYQYNAQMLDRESTWASSEFLARYHLRGTNENDYVWITEGEALDIIETWLTRPAPHRRRLSRPPTEPVRPRTGRWSLWKGRLEES